jgi:2-methylcitrate dehydratase PrpD
LGERRPVAERLAAALTHLGGFSAELDWDAVPIQVRERLQLVLLDHLGVTAAGSATPEGRSLVAAVDPPEGPAPVIGTRRRAGIETAAWLNAINACSLELDEGNKYSRGHPAAHAFPAAIAVGAARQVSGREFLCALLAGYEVAARFGAATSLLPGVHPHGNWGVAGAAAAVSRLLHLDADKIAAALDAASGLALATPFDVALAGNPVRDAWVGSANVSGIAAARLAGAGLAMVDATAEGTLGWLLGELNIPALDRGIGSEWLVTRGYFKRHASCSYTHPPADALLDLAATHPDLRADDVTAITIETHHLAAALSRTETPTRLAAMFSVPYVTAVALLHGDCIPSRFGDDARADPEVRRLVTATTVVRSPEFDDRLPDERAARVTVRLRDGRELAAEVSNPVGDADHRPLGLDDIRSKLDGLLAGVGLDAAVLEKVVTALPVAGEASELLAELA